VRRKDHWSTDVLPCESVCECVYVYVCVCVRVFHSVRSSKTMILHTYTELIEEARLRKEVKLRAILGSQNAKSIYIKVRSVITNVQ